MRSATTVTATIVSRRMTKPTVPAVPGSMRRNSTGRDAAAEGAGEAPAEDDQQDDGRNPHLGAVAGEELAPLAEEDEDADDQRREHDELAARAARVLGVDLRAEASLAPSLGARLEHPARHVTAVSLVAFESHANSSGWGLRGVGVCVPGHTAVRSVARRPAVLD